MVNPEQQNHDLARIRVEAFKNAARNIREAKITPDGVSSLFHSARAVGEDVMHLNPVAATVFAMGFGSVALTHATLEERGITHHADGSTTEIPLNTPSVIGKTITRYIHNHFNRNAELKSISQVQLFREARGKLLATGISSEYLDDIWEIGAQVTLDIFPFDYYHQLKATKGIDISKFSVEYFEQVAQKVPKRPYFILDEDTYEESIKQTGEWLHGRFEEILENVASGKYLLEQEMS